MEGQPPCIAELPRISLSEIGSSNSYNDLLGLHWSVEDDFSSFDFKKDDLNDKIYKRIVLAIESKFYDPLGWLAPVIITAKIFRLAKLGWDDSLPKELNNEFLTWYDFKLILSIKMLYNSLCF